jgi:hypothetical protein
VYSGQRQWVGNWLLVSGQTEWRFDTHGSDAGAVLNRAVDIVTDRIASRDAVILSRSGLERVRLRIAGIETLPHYARLTDYFKGLLPVEHARLVSLSGGTQEWELHLATALDAFVQLLERDGRLRAVPVSTEPLVRLTAETPLSPEPAGTPTFDYVWLDRSLGR